MTHAAVETVYMHVIKRLRPAFTTRMKAARRNSSKLPGLTSGFGGAGQSVYTEHMALITSKYRHTTRATSPLN